MKYLFSVFVAVVALVFSVSSFAFADNSAKSENVLAIFQDSTHGEIKYEVVKINDATFFRTKIDPFIKLNAHRLSGKRAALDMLQVKLIEFATRKKNFSAKTLMHVSVAAGYVSIDLEKTKIDGRAINIIDLITSNAEELFF